MTIQETSTFENLAHITYYVACSLHGTEFEGGWQLTALNAPGDRAHSILFPCVPLCAEFCVDYAAEVWECQRQPACRIRAQSSRQVRICTGRNCVASSINGNP
jgi:hypothetical protein